MLLSFPSLVDQFQAKVSGVIHVGGHIGEELKVNRDRDVKDLIMFEPQKHCYDHPQ